MPRLVTSFLLFLGMMSAALAAATPPDDDDAEERARPETELVVTARRLDVARESVEASLGASTYTLTNDAIEQRPGGETTSVGRILLQVPSVAQDGSGSIRVRGARGAVQYRINNVIVPEGIADFGERLSPRLADRVTLITGALPAQYGLRAGSVVNIVTKSGTYQEGGQAELYGGGPRELQPAFEYSFASGATGVFASGSYLRSGLGLAAPDGRARPLHDRTDQIEAFAFADHVIDADSRVSLILGTANERFQIPDPRGLDAASYAGPGAFQRPLIALSTTHFASERLAGGSSENSQYAILTYLRSEGAATVQASLFGRSSTRGAHPDPIGTLLFAGLSRDGSESDLATGLQIEGAYVASPAHRLRAGLILTADRQRRRIDTLVLPVDALGRQTSDQPLTVRLRGAGDRGEASTYIQDEWTPVARLTVNLGLRADHVGGAGGGRALSPRASLVWSGPGGTTLHAGYARYFVPAPQEAGTSPSLAGTTGAPPGSAGAPTRAETDDYYDIGVQQALGDLTLGIDTYRRDARNLLDERASGSPLVRQMFNYAHGRQRGIEFSMTYAEGPLSAWAALALACGTARRIVTGQAWFTAAELASAAARAVRLDGDQNITASGGVAYRLGAVHLSGTFHYGSGLPRTHGPGRLPGYVQADVAAVYRFDGLRDRPLDFRIDLTNLFDRRYEIRDGGGVGADLPEWGPRRGLFIGLEQAF